MAGSDDGGDSEAARLFREAMRDVRQLKPSPGDAVAPPSRTAGVPRPRRPATSPAAPGVEEPPKTTMADALSADRLPTVGRGDHLEYRAPGVATSTFRQLRRGQYRVEGAVDLHGLTAERAATVLHAFMEEARAERARCVKVVHGKGIGSGDRGPVLKTLVNAWLREQADVLAFISAPREDGGTGAVYVLLRRHRREQTPRRGP